MDPELEELLKALDAVRETRSKADYLRYQRVYESRLDEVIERRPGVTRHALEKAVTIAYHRWIIAQNRPSTLPPTA